MRRGTRSVNAAIYRGAAPVAKVFAQIESGDERQMAGREEIVTALERIALFADLSPPELEAVAGEFHEVWFGAGDRILREGMSGSSFYVLLEGECSVMLDGREVGRLGRGEFFGEMSILLESPPTADVAAVTGVRCLMMGPEAAERFFMAHPKLLYRMLKALARRLDAANRRIG